MTDPDDRAALAAGCLIFGLPLAVIAGFMVLTAALIKWVIS